MNKMIPVAALAAVAAVAGGFTMTTTGAPEIAVAPTAVAQEADATTTEAPAEAADVQEMVLGAEDAPVTVIEYASFTCPHCADFHETSFDQLKADYIDTGKVRFIYREVYFDRPGLWASMVARCGGAEKFFPIAGMIYDTQNQWLSGGSGEAIAGALRRIGLTAGLDGAQIDACLSDAATAQALYARFEETTEADGITATPTFVIDGEAVANKPYPQIAADIDAALGE